jgi:DNA processing protein
LHCILDNTSPEEVLKLSKVELIELGFNDTQATYILNRGGTDVDRCLLWSEGSNHSLLFSNQEQYPALLKEIVTYPPMLFVKGKVEALSLPQIGVVGSRNASIDGLRIATQFSRELTKIGMSITSGLAMGVDGHAHRACIDGSGKTIAVLGNGFDYIYPKQHHKLSLAIQENGALVSEFPPYYPPRAYNFPRRNRVISGLSTGVLVIEAAEKSGSLITARFALEQGRDVFALPGSILNPNARGCNQLIRDGAVLVQSVEDIAQEINGLVNWSASKQQSLIDLPQKPTQVEASDPVLSLLGEIPIAVDFLAERTHLTVNKVMMRLLELELQGLVASAGGGYIRLRGS